jgi:hypothetical protein
MSSEGLQVHNHKEGVTTLTGNMDEFVLLCDEDEQEAVKDSFNEYVQEFDKAIFNAVFAGQVPWIWKHKNQYAVASNAIYDYQKVLIKVSEQAGVNNDSNKENAVISISLADNKKVLLAGFYERHGLREQNLRLRTRQKSKSSLKIKGVIITKKSSGLFTS